MQDVQWFVRNCHVCGRSKVSWLLVQGLLQLLLVLERWWLDISMDFMTRLLESNRANAILVFVDQLSKMRHFVACRATDEGSSAEKTAKMFLDAVVKLHGLPASIVSDRGLQFVSAFWKHLCQRLGIKVKLSTAYHPESDSQTKNSNQTMEQYLHAFVSYQQDNWTEWLLTAEFAANNHKSETTGLTPFFANYSFHPWMGTEPAALYMPKMTAEHLQ